MSENVTSDKYKSIVAAANSLFFKYGFRKVTVEEICKEAAISKMTFYRFFSNKYDLAKEVYSETVDEGVNRFIALMEEDIPPKEKIKKMLLLKAESTKTISKEFIQDFYSSAQPELKEFVEQKTAEVWTNMLSTWKKAQQDGVFRKDIKAEFIIASAMKFIDIMQDEKLLKLYNTPQELIMEVANFFTYGIAPHD